VSGRHIGKRFARRLCQGQKYGCEEILHGIREAREHDDLLALLAVAPQEALLLLSAPDTRLT
jgi:hypothetical protein